MSEQTVVQNKPKKKGYRHKPPRKTYKVTNPLLLDRIYEAGLLPMIVNRTKDIDGTIAYNFLKDSKLEAVIDQFLNEAL